MQPATPITASARHRRLRRLEVDDELDLNGLLERQVSGFGALEGFTCE
jgi:hypothetical protein